MKDKYSAVWVSHSSMSDYLKCPLWEKVAGKKGGFADADQEEMYKTRGREMIKRVADNPGPLKNKAIKIRQELPYYWLSEEENIILCGKIDWLEYVEASDSVRILDFKTGKFDEDPDSLQLPIYYLLASHCQSRPVSGVMYWYINRNTEPQILELPNIKISEERVLEIAKRVKLARTLDRFVCKSKDGCNACRPLESVVEGKAMYVGLNDFGQDLYVL